MAATDLEKQIRKRAGSSKAFVPYLTAGLPSPQRFTDLAADISQWATALEVGIPFSDPIMDGPIIQEASTRALESGMNVEACFALLRETTRYADVPLVVMTYYNPIHRMGLPRFAKRLADVGVAGAIVPDLTFEESDELHREFRKNGIALVRMISPTTSEKRAAAIAKASAGFVYAVSRLGVTGEQQSLAESAAEVVSTVRPHTKLPVLLGLGVSDAEQAKEAVRFADGVIVGSAIMKKVLAGDTAGVKSLAKEISAALA